MPPGANGTSAPAEGCCAAHCERCGCCFRGVRGRGRHRCTRVAHRPRGALSLPARVHMRQADVRHRASCPLSLSLFSSFPVMGSRDPFAAVTLQDRTGACVCVHACAVCGWVWVCARTHALSSLCVWCGRRAVLSLTGVMQLSYPSPRRATNTSATIGGDQFVGQAFCLHHPGPPADYRRVCAS